MFIYLVSSHVLIYAPDNLQSACNNSKINPLILNLFWNNDWQTVHNPLYIYEECEMVFVSLRLSCGVCKFALVLKQVCMWLPVGWVCRVGIFQAPCCSRNICPLCGTNQSAEPKAVTNQAAWWSFHGILGWSWNKGLHLPHSRLLPPASPHPSGFDILDPHMGKSPPLHSIIPRIMTEKWRT